jgi:uroporphyrinogen-III synthase
MTRPLEGRTIGLAEARQLEELEQLLESDGATVLRYPMVRIQDAPDTAAVRAWLQELIDGRFGYLVLMTGEALKRLLGFAEREGLREAVIAALQRTRTVTRGPKPVRALKEVGLTPSVVAQAPTTEGVIATLRGEPLEGQTVGVTLFGDANPVLEQFLTAAGAVMRPVLAYVYVPATDDDLVADLIARTARGEVDVLVFTSSPQVERLFEVAARRRLEPDLGQGLGKTRVAAVGPVVADTLRRHGASVAICPEQGFVMKNLVQLIKRDLASSAGN